MDNLPKFLKDFDTHPDCERNRHRKLEFADKRHVKYFQMCLNVLPSRMQNQDSNKLALVYFSLLSLDVLRSVEPVVCKSAEQRAATLEWIYKHYNGDGFRGSLTHQLGDGSADSSSSDDFSSPSYDPANLPATYFGLCVLALLQDHSLTTKVNRFRIMSYVRRCQLPNGAFTATLDVAGRPSGEHDLRICLIASLIRTMLLMDAASAAERARYDIDVDRLEEYILSCRDFDGGFGGVPHNESHAGHTFCAVAALRLLGRIPRGDKEGKGKHDLSETVRWLVERQLWFNEFNKDDFDDNELLTFEDMGGMNGRMNKYADTCYAFWVVGSLKVLGQERLVHRAALEYYLLQVTQSLLVGGFAKINGEMPDPYHSCLGIAALKLAGSRYLAGCKGVDECLVITEDAKEFLFSLEW